MSQTPNVDRAIESLEAVMQRRPGPYPDPRSPIEVWQLAHAHLLAARELLRIALRGMGEEV